MDIQRIFHHLNQPISRTGMAMSNTLQGVICVERLLPSPNHIKPQEPERKNCWNFVEPAYRALIPGDLWIFVRKELCPPWLKGMNLTTQKTPRIHLGLQVRENWLMGTSAFGIDEDESQEQVNGEFFATYQHMPLFADSLGLAHLYKPFKTSIKFNLNLIHMKKEIHLSKLQFLVSFVVPVNMALHLVPSNSSPSSISSTFENSFLADKALRAALAVSRALICGSMKLRSIRFPVIGDGHQVKSNHKN